MNEIEARYVKPFYLDMMGMNAVQNADRLWPELVAAGRAVTSDDVSWMLRCGAWRPGVLGGWPRAGRASRGSPGRLARGNAV